LAAGDHVAGDRALAEVAARASAGVGGRYQGLAVGVLGAARAATVGVGHVEAGGHRVDGETSFQIGSVTKVVTALLLAVAVVRGEVTLDQRLDTLIPLAANHRDGPPITLGDLATHTSGLPRLPPGLWRQARRNRHDPYASFTTGDLVQALTAPPKLPAGRTVRYSNYGAGVLGEALSRAVDLPYRQLVADRITGPLGMSRTGVDRPSMGDNTAEGHSRRRRPVDDWHLPALAGAGALRSTAADMLAFLDAHLEPASSPLAQAIELSIAPRHQLRGALRIGLGWHVLDRRRRAPVWWHNGGTGGFFSFVGFVPDTQVAVAVLTNTARSVDQLGMQLLTDIEDATKP
jgi:serine-type D-Ala-D-Ala carboxypeptidase/endopeptidase